MKIKKIVSSAIILSLFIPNLNSVAYTEISNRYETMEGEHIVIEDSIAGNLREIEIFGNTVQDENNLENIQSVGELYVDKVGNPILDSNGKKQYFVNIKTVGKNLFNEKYFEKKSINGLNGVTSNSSDRMTSMIAIPCKKGDIITAKIFSDDFNFRELYYYSAKEIGATSYLGKVTKNSSVIALVKECTFTATENGYFTFQILKSDTSNSTFTDEDVEKAKQSIQISYGDRELTEYTPYVESIVKVLLPTQLCKVGNVGDRLYWDENENRYLIQKNIKEDVLDGTETNWIKSGSSVNLDGQNTISFQRPMSGIIYNTERVLRILSDKFKGIEVSSASEIIKDTEWIRPYSSTSENVGIRILKSKLSGESVDDFKAWLKKNPVKIYYHLRTPEIIETKITSKLVIPIHDYGTLLSTDIKEEVHPKLKVNVDRLSKIATDKVLSLKNDSSVQNVSEARMYVNMLPDSLYKDRLQDILNNTFVTTGMDFEKKNITANMDIYVKYKNMLSMSLSTNRVTFENYSGVDELEMLNAVEITVNSSLPYSLNVSMPSEIYNKDKTNSMPISILNVRESGQSQYKNFVNTTDKIVLKDDCNAGNDNYHRVDLKLASNEAYKADVYKAVLKFEVQQK